jgi:hypothetical protein
VALLDAQRRLRELGRIRLGEKGDRGAPKKLSTFRLTSPNGALLEAAAKRWGGEPAVWRGAPSGGAQFEVTLDVAELDVLVPPQDVESSQWYELWSGGGCERRCDGTTETIGDQPCVCDEEQRECKPTTHLLVMLPQLPDVGVWRLTSHGYNAAHEIPSTVAILRQLSGGTPLPAAILAIEQRSSIAEGRKKNYAVPVLRVPYTLAQLDVAGLPGQTGDAALEARPALPVDASFADERVSVEGGHGPQPGTPGVAALAPGNIRAGGQESSILGEGGCDSPSGSNPAGFTRDEAWASLVVNTGSIAAARSQLNDVNGTSYTPASISTATIEEIHKAIRAS